MSDSEVIMTRPSCQQHNGQLIETPTRQASQSITQLRRSTRRQQLSQQNNASPAESAPTTTKKRKAICWNLLYHPGAGPFIEGFQISWYYCKENTTSANDASSSLGSRHYKKRRTVDDHSCQVTRYCDMPNDDVGPDTDVLEWWKSQQHKFPQLAAMARDVFSAVGTSTPSERAFSSSKETITDRRNRLGVKTVEALQVTKRLVVH